MSRDPSPAAQSTEPPSLTVSQLTLLVKETLETTFGDFWVSGEISSLARPASGHVYFTLKDDQAQIKAVLWRTAAQRARFNLEDGLEVLCQGELEVYAPRGQYQLVVRQIVPRGMGALQLALRQLHARLAAEGLFNPERKRPLPRFPRRIALVTSPTGAAIHDFLQVLRRRWSLTDVLVVPTRVQGMEAGDEIAAAIRRAGKIPGIDLMVVARGGGSVEDLWCFNDEAVVRALAASPVPTVSAVGHEIDVTLSDLAADVRALTPSEAAERVVPSGEEIAGALRGTQQRLSGLLRARLTSARRRLELLAERRPLRRPFEGLHDWARRLDELSLRAERAVRGKVTSAQRQMRQMAGQLESLSPLAVLGRGYSLTQLIPGGEIVRSAAELQPGQEIRTRLARGEVISRVESVASLADQVAAKSAQHASAESAAVRAPSATTSEQPAEACPAGDAAPSSIPENSQKDQNPPRSFDDGHS